MLAIQHTDNAEPAPRLITIDLNDVEIYLDEDEGELFIALIDQMAEAKKRIEDESFEPHDWKSEPVEEAPVGSCSVCKIMPDRSHEEDNEYIIKCPSCDRSVNGDSRAEQEVENEWLRLNSTPTMPAGPHVVACNS